MRCVVLLYVLRAKDYLFFQYLADLIFFKFYAEYAIMCQYFRNFISKGLNLDKSKIWLYINLYMHKAYFVKQGHKHSRTSDEVINGINNSLKIFKVLKYNCSIKKTRSSLFYVARNYACNIH